MYDVEGTECLKNIPHCMHESIIRANQQIDKQIKSNPESGYDDLELESYCQSQQLKIMKEYNRSLSSYKHQ
ncbi:MAG: hypothetical protein EBR67_11355 [Proteobacteria bacterium]|nr:hypothetical protein [Pseudomonadota bacterium]